jgi:hypothetical protein
MIDLYIISNKGIIESVNIYSDALDIDFISSLQKQLANTEYSKDGILNKLNMNNIDEISLKNNESNLNDFKHWLINNL